MPRHRLGAGGPVPDRPTAQRSAGGGGGAADQWRKVGEPGPGARVRGYIRFSHEEGRHGHTVEQQQAEMRAYLEARGWALDGWDVEEATSAKYEELERRPVFRRHLERAERGDFHVSLCYMNDRWARNKIVAYVSLSRLRRTGVWWATTDGRWHIDRIEEDGWDIAYAVDVTLNAAYSRKVSEKTRIAKRLRAEAGYHNGDVTYGYARPPDPARPVDAGSDWRPPRQALAPHPENFARLQQIGTWAAAGLSDLRIAERCNLRGWRTQARKAIGTRRHLAGVDPESGAPLLGQDLAAGPRPFSKDSIRSLLLNPFPRAFAPGSDRGTVVTPAGVRVEGRHPAAWDWELCRRMDEQRRLRHGGSRRHGRPWPFSGVVVCAHCGTRLRAQATPDKRGGVKAYYRDEARSRGLACALPAGVWRSVRAEVLDAQFADEILSRPLPDGWRERIAAEYAQLATGGTDWDAVAARRRSLEAERERAKFLFLHGLMPEAELLRHEGRIREVLELLPDPERDGPDGAAARTLAAGETLASLQAYWHERASDEDRAELVHLLLLPEGLGYDLAAGRIAWVRPRPAFLPILQLTLADAGWAAREGVLRRVGDDAADDDENEQPPRTQVVQGG